MRNRAKQRTLGNKGGVDRLKEEPHLSGAYIRSLVKQLTSSRNHRLTENTRVSNGEAACTANHVKNEELPPSVDHENKNGQFQVPAAADTSLDNLEASNLNERQDIKAKEIPGGMQKKLSTIYEATDTVQQPRRPKKQVRRRLQTSRPYQEHVLDMAEARREIVTALKYHRASMGTNSLTSKPDPVTSSKTERMKSRRTGKNYQAGTRCHACIVKPDIHRANEAKTITVCGHLLCWKCLGEWLNFCSPANDCPVCSKSLRSNDVIPISCHSSAPHSIEIPDQDSLFDVALPQGSINDIQHPKHQQEYPGPGLGLSSQEEESLKSNELDALAEHSVPLVCNPIPAWSTSETPMIAIQHPVLDPSITSQHPISLHPSQPTVDLQTHNSTILLADSRSPLSWQTALSSNSCSTPIQSSITSSILDQDCKSWHVAMDDEELAEIRSLGDQHEMEWNDTVNLVTSAWWFKFMNNPEFSDNQMLKPYQPECDSLDILAALPTESLWQDELPIDSHDWTKDINKRDCTEFGDNQSMSEPSINSENLPSAPKLFNSEEQLDDTAIQRCDCVSDPQNPASR